MDLWIHPPYLPKPHDKFCQQVYVCWNHQAKRQNNSAGWDVWKTSHTFDTRLLRSNLLPPFCWEGMQPGSSQLLWLCSCQLSLEKTCSWIVGFIQHNILIAKSNLWLRHLRRKKPSNRTLGWSMSQYHHGNLRVPNATFFRQQGLKGLLINHFCPLLIPLYFGVGVGHYP